MMQIFVRDWDKTLTIDVDQDMTVFQLMRMIQNKSGTPMPLMSVMYTGKRLEMSQTLGHYGIEKEHTVHINNRIHAHMYVKWQGNWLRSNKSPDLFENFCTSLAKKNKKKRKRTPQETKAYSEPTLENLTVFHLKKAVAKIVRLDNAEIELFPLKVELDANEGALDDSFLLTECGQDMFVAKLKKNI